MKNIEHSTKSTKVAVKAPSAHIEKKPLSDAELAKIVGAGRAQGLG